MPRPRTGVTLADRAETIPTTAIPRSAGNGAPCEHRSGCKRPWTSWTVRGPRCEEHPLTPAETPVIGPDDRQPRVRGGSSTTLARGRRRDDSASDPHPFAPDPGISRRICADCGLGTRATVHRTDADADTPLD